MTLPWASKTPTLRWHKRSHRGNYPRPFRMMFWRSWIWWLDPRKRQIAHWKTAAHSEEPIYHFLTDFFWRGVERILVLWWLLLAWHFAFAISLSDGSRYHGNQSICLFPSRQKTSREETVRKVKTAHVASLCAPSLVAPLGELEARRSLCAAEGQRHATH